MKSRIFLATNKHLSWGRAALGQATHASLPNLLDPGSVCWDMMGHPLEGSWGESTWREKTRGKGKEGGGLESEGA